MLSRGCRRTTTGDSIGLLDEDDRDAEREGRRGRRHEVARTDPDTCTVPEEQRAHGIVGAVDVEACETMGRLDLPNLDFHSHIQLEKTCRSACSITSARVGGSRRISIISRVAGSPLAS